MTNKPWIAPEFPAVHTNFWNTVPNDLQRAMGMDRSLSELGAGSPYPKMVYRSDTSGRLYLLYPYTNNSQDVMLLVLRSNKHLSPQLEIAWLLPHGPEWKDTVSRWMDDITHHINHRSLPKGRLLLYKDDGGV